MTLFQKIQWLLSLAGASAVSLAIAQFAVSQTSPALPGISDEPLPSPPAVTSDDTANARTEPQPLDDGPVHEAFAEPLTPGAEQGLVVTKEPPQPIDETPPEYRPEGENVEWIPGYWMWLEQQDDFVWVSGLWRSVPPGRTWTPGHWATTDGDYVWISGFWSDLNTQQVEYLPYPPDSLEQGPSSDAPSDNHFWIPGCWQWESNQYAWRPGYWYPGQSNWMWVPNHYVYTPRGAVLVNGYWDYPVQRRGLLYAPVYWNGGYRYGAGYSFTPNRVVNTALLLSALFVDNNRGYYYYGNGYAGRNNYLPWYATGRNRGFYSPMYGYYSWQYGRDSSKWRDRFDYSDRRRDDDDFRDRRDGRDRDGRSRLVGTVDDFRYSRDDIDRRDRDGDRNRADRREGDRWDDNIRKLTDDERRDTLDRSRKMEQYRSARAEFESQQRGDNRTRREQSADGNRDQRNRGQAGVSSDFQRSTFDLQTAAGAEELRQQARERNQRYQQRVMRQDTSNQNRGGDSRDQRNFDQRRQNAEQAAEGNRSREARQQASARDRQPPPQSPQRTERRQSVEPSDNNRGRSGDARSSSGSNNRQQSAEQSQRSRGRSSDARGSSNSNNRRQAAEQSQRSRGGSNNARGNSSGSQRSSGNRSSSNRGNSGGNRGGGKNSRD